MRELDLGRELTRRELLVLAASAGMTTLLAACGATGGGATATAGTGSSPSSGAGGGGADGGGTTIRMVDGNAFDPSHLTIRAGDTVRWENASSSIHTATCDLENPLGVEHALPDGAEPFNSGNVNLGDTYEHTFDVPGDYTYSCMLHLRMVGHLTVSG